jgi:hypothetical protein
MENTDSDSSRYCVDMEMETKVAMQRQDAISRLHVGAPCTLAPTLARLERSRAAKPLWSPNTNRATVNTSTCRRHEDYRASHRRMWFDVRLRRTLTPSQGYKSYAVRTVISGWFVYHPHREPTQRSQQAGTTVSILLQDSTAPESPTFSMRYVSSSASRIWEWFEHRTCR